MRKNLYLNGEKENPKINIKIIHIDATYKGENTTLQPPKNRNNMNKFTRHQKKKKNIFEIFMRETTNITKGFFPESDIKYM